MWYVVQVRTGTEESIRKQYENMKIKNKMKGEIKGSHCFIPRYEELKRYHGKWHRERKLLFPGYVFLISSKPPEELTVELKCVMGLTRLLGIGETVVALSQEEIQLLTRLGGNEQITAVSRGIIQNDEVIVLEGPLKGREGYICKIDRHKRKAWLELRMFGRTQKVEVGLEIVDKKQRADIAARRGPEKGEKGEETNERPSGKRSVQNENCSQ